LLVCCIGQELGAAAAQLLAAVVVNAAFLPERASRYFRGTAPRRCCSPGPRACNHRRGRQLRQSAAARGHQPRGGAGDGRAAPPGATRTQLTPGERIFEGKASGGTCAGCHGADAKGTSVGPDLISGHFLWSDGSPTSLRRIITQGVPHPKRYTGAMPPKGGAELSSQDVAAVADYVLALSHIGKK
jgi:mono/diheme cytochrome c family protein